jgi:hypothetical protein
MTREIHVRFGRFLLATQSNDQIIKYDNWYSNKRCHSGEGNNTRALSQYDVLKNQVQCFWSKGTRYRHVGQESYMIYVMQ